MCSLLDVLCEVNDRDQKEIQELTHMSTSHSQSQLQSQSHTQLSAQSQGPPPAVPLAPLIVTNSGLLSLLLSAIMHLSLSIVFVCKCFIRFCLFFPIDPCVCYFFVRLNTRASFAFVQRLLFLQFDSKSTLAGNTLIQQRFFCTFVCVAAFNFVP